eukprot:2771821-Rhodomonas_salina.3
MQYCARVCREIKGQEHRTPVYFVIWNAVVFVIDFAVCAVPFNFSVEALCSKKASLHADKGRSRHGEIKSSVPASPLQIVLDTWSLLFECDVRFTYPAWFVCKRAMRFAPSYAKHGTGVAFSLPCSVHRAVVLRYARY